MATFVYAVERRSISNTSKRIDSDINWSPIPNTCTRLKRDVLVTLREIQDGNWGLMLPNNNEFRVSKFNMVRHK